MLGKYWIFYVCNGKAKFVLDCNTLKEVCNCRMELVLTDKADGTYEPDSYHIVRVENPDKMMKLWNENKAHLYNVNVWLEGNHVTKKTGVFLACTDREAREKGKRELTDYLVLGAYILNDMVRCSARKI